MFWNLTSEVAFAELSVTPFDSTIKSQCTELLTEFVEENHFFKFKEYNAKTSKPFVKRLVLMFKIKMIFLGPCIIFFNRVHISIVEASYVISWRRNYLLWIREGWTLKAIPFNFFYRNNGCYYLINKHISMISGASCSKITCISTVDINCQIKEYYYALPESI